MKLKYYLRGIGIGVIVATLIMAVSSVIHNNNLSDEMIIKEAQKLGMIMPENKDDKDSLWGNSTETESDSESASEDSNVDVPVSTENEESSESQGTENTQTTEDVQDTEDVQASDEENMAWITIYDTDSARHVSNKLQAAGVIEDAVDFRSYLANKGYATIIRSGTFRIPKGSTYEEICDIIMRRR